MSNLLNHPNEIINTITDEPIGTGFLAFRDLGKLLEKYAHGKQALDFGCGAGRSSRLLKKLGFNVIGVDIVESMLIKAKSRNDGIPYYLVCENNFDPISNKQFDVILVSFVLMEIESEKLIINMLKMLSTLLSFNGKIVVIAASNDFYYGHWLSLDAKYEKNNPPKSGEIVNIYLKDYNVEISDYLWTESDCEKFFEKSSLKVVEKVKPLGIPSDGKAWIDELVKSPFVIYILENISK